MTLKKTLHIRSPLFRDLLVAVIFLSFGFLFMPANFLADDKTFHGLVVGMSLGFGFAWLIHTLRIAKAAGQINNQNQINFDDKE